MKNAYRVLAPLALALLMTACGAETTNPGATPTRARPTASFAALRAYDGFRGEDVTVELMASAEAGLSKLQLLLDGEKVVAANVSGPSVTRTLGFDGSQVADGIHEMKLVAVDVDGQQGESAAVPVVFYNGGQQMVVAPQEGTVIIPESYTSGDLDLKHHWQNPAGVARIVAFLAWDTADQAKPWNLELAVGSGECPDIGEILSERVVGTEGAIVATATPSGNQVTTGLHFAHIRPLNAAEHKGESLPYRVGVYVFPK